jgi:hypothetical protein
MTCRSGSSKIQNKEETDMANSSAARAISLDDVRDSVKRVQHEGERLVTRLRNESERVVVQARRQAEGVRERLGTEVRRLADVPVPSAIDDLRKQLRQLLVELEDRRTAFRHDLEKRRADVTRDLRKRSNALAARITRSLGAAEATRVTSLSREVTGLELRVAELERKLADVMGQLKEKAAAKKKDKEKDAAA